ncbi:MAG: hypothetical protein QNJ34_17890 [Xenococcaceae cyanobacterium MO_188.B29]|nr:hypothetical protein [Xenococcaceae cyanobacterium MO_188.B29]
MLESSLCNNKKTNSQKNLIKNFSTNRPENFLPNEIDTNNNQEFQNLVNQMILNLVAKTEAELITISTITQKYREIAPQKN